MSHLHTGPMDDVVAGAFVSAGPPPKAQQGYLRVVSWNIERGLQFSGILEFLTTAAADLILLQEVDVNARRTRCRDVARDLAQALGMNYVFGTEFEELGAGSGGVPAHHGLATLSPWPLSNGRVIRFRRQSSFWQPRWYVPKVALFQRRLGGRIALVCEAHVHNRRIAAYNLHLESKGADELRRSQLRETLEDAHRYAEACPVVIGGDFNLAAVDGEAAAALRAARFRDAVALPSTPTTVAGPSFKGARCIDWICVSGGVPVVGRICGDVRASDHYPVTTTIAIS